MCNQYRVCCWLRVVICLRYPPLHWCASYSHEHIGYWHLKGLINSHDTKTFTKMCKPSSHGNSFPPYWPFCKGNPLVTSGFPSQRASSMEIGWFTFADQTVELRLMPDEMGLTRHPFNIYWINVSEFIENYQQINVYWVFTRGKRQWLTCRPGTEHMAACYISEQTMTQSSNVGS